MDPFDAVRRLALAGDPIGLMLDYDGTLVPLTYRPELAVPDGELLDVITRLARHPRFDVHIVSGRPHTDIDEYFGTVAVGLHAEHGLWARPSGGAWSARLIDPTPWRDAVERLLADAVDRVEGTWIEYKSAGFAWHWRLAVLPAVARELERLRDAVRVLAPLGAGILEGNGIFEVRPEGVGKGDVARELVARDPARRWIVAGDDRTDEEMFVALPPTSIRIKVGGGESVAEFRVASPDEIRLVLQELAG